MSLLQEQHQRILDNQQEILNQLREPRPSTSSATTAPPEAAPELLEDLLASPFSDPQEFEDWLADITLPENSQSRRRLVSCLFLLILGFIFCAINDENTNI